MSQPAKVSGECSVARDEDQIHEEQERREREAQIPARLPRALEETHRHLPGASSAAERTQDQLPTMEGPTRRIVDRVFSPQPT